MLKYFTISAALITMLGLNVAAHAGSLDISIKCFGKTDGKCEKDEMGILNNGAQKASHLTISCPAMDAPKTLYTISSFNLDSGEMKCISKSDLADNCRKTNGFFVKRNVEIVLKSEDENYSKWKETKSCTWEN